MSGPHLALIIFKVPKMTLIHSQSWKALFNFTETRTEKLVLDWLYWKQLTKPDKIHGATASSPEEHPLYTQKWENVPYNQAIQAVCWNRLHNNPGARNSKQELKKKKKLKLKFFFKSSFREKLIRNYRKFQLYTKPPGFSYYLRFVFVIIWCCWSVAKLCPTLLRLHGL